MTTSISYCEACFLVCVLLYAQLVSLPNNVFASASSNEAEALQRWRASFQNQIQNKLTSWTSSHSNSTNTKANASPCNGWTGISCNTAGSVNKINLTNSGIQGMLHDLSFTSFPNLEYIDLSLNGLYDAIPPQIGYLSKLIYLDLSVNQFSGQIPPETIARLAIACKHSHPQSRPTMHMVSQVLSSQPADSFTVPEIILEHLIK